MGATKQKVSITIATELLDRIDRYAKRSGIGNRSGVIERWLHQAARMEASRELEADTVAYYESLSESEIAEDRQWSWASSEAFADLDID